MILNIENYTVKIDFEARTVEVAQEPLNVENENQTTLNQWVPTDEEMVEMHREMNPEPSQAEIDAQRLDDFELHFGRKATLEEATELFGDRTIDALKNWCEVNSIPRANRYKGRRPGIVEAQPREVCRSTCCGTLGRRTRDGSCAGCRGVEGEQ